MLAVDAASDPTESARSLDRLGFFQYMPGDMKDGSIQNGRTYMNEFSGSWEHRLPHTSSISSTLRAAMHAAVNSPQSSVTAATKSS